MSSDHNWSFKEINYDSGKRVEFDQKKELDDGLRVMVYGLIFVVIACMAAGLLLD